MSFMNNQYFHASKLASESGKNPRMATERLCEDLVTVEHGKALYDPDSNHITWPGQFGYRKPFSDDSEADWAAWLSSCVLDSEESDGRVSLTVSDCGGRYGHADVRVSIPTTGCQAGTVSVKVTSGDGLSSCECERTLERQISDEILRAYWDADDNEED